MPFFVLPGVFWLAGTKLIVATTPGAATLFAAGAATGAAVKSSSCKK